MRVGVLANPMVLSWQEAALENVAALDGVSIDHVVIDASVRKDSSILKQGANAVNRGEGLSLSDVRLFSEAFDEMGWKALIFADQKFGWMAFDEDSRMDSLQSEPVESVEALVDAAVHECEPVSAGGPWNTLPEDVTETIGAECDVVIRFAFGLLKGPILDAPTHGVLSTHGSDIREYRGMGPKITFLEDDERASVTLQMLTEEIDGGYVVDISSEELPEKPTLADVYEAISRLQREIFATGISKLQSDDFSPWQPDELGEYHSHSKQEEDLGFVLRLLLKNTARRVRQKLV